MSEHILKLSKPIKAHNEELSELQLREPIIEEVMEIGYPYLILMKDGQEAGIEIRPGVIVRYVSKLASIPMGSAKQMSLSDLTKAQAIVMGFFGEEIVGQSSS